ncbi:NAD-dependent malic enzyme [Streptomyces alboniger]
MPEDVLRWTGGKALVAVGIPVPPVELDGERAVGQANNALLYPGLGLGAVVADAERITDGMLQAAAEAVAGLATCRSPAPPCCRRWRTCAPRRPWSPRPSPAAPPRRAWPGPTRRRHPADPGRHVAADTADGARGQRRGRRGGRRWSDGGGRPSWRGRATAPRCGDAGAGRPSRRAIGTQTVGVDGDAARCKARAERTWHGEARTGLCPLVTGCRPFSGLLDPGQPAPVGAASPRSAGTSGPSAAQWSSVMVVAMPLLILTSAEKPFLAAVSSSASVHSAPPSPPGPVFTASQMSS